MAFYPTTNIQFANSPSIDAFARLRVSNPFTLFESQKSYTSSSGFWETLTSGTGGTSYGTIIHEPYNSQVVLKVGQGNGDRVVRQTRQYWPYQPGKSQLIIMTGAFGPISTANTVKRIGYFDDWNGVGFMVNGHTISIFQRTFATSAVVEEIIPQISWNINTMLEGTGQEIYTTSANIYWIDLEWLGVGRVRYGVFSERGVPLLVHEELHANALTGVYMTTATLPLRYEISNTGATTASHQLQEICSAVISEGGFDFGRARIRSYTLTGTGVGISSTAMTNILSFRSATSFGTSGVIPRATMKPSSFATIAWSANYIFELVFEGSNASNSGAGWSSVYDSPFEINREGWVSSGGAVLHSGFCVSGSAGSNPTAPGQAGLTQTNTEQVFFPTLNLSGNKSTILTIRAQAINGSGSAQVSFDWFEYW